MAIIDRTLQFNDRTYDLSPLSANTAKITGVLDLSQTAMANSWVENDDGQEVATPVAALFRFPAQCYLNIRVTADFTTSPFFEIGLRTGAATNALNNVVASSVFRGSDLTLKESASIGLTAGLPLNRYLGLYVISNEGVATETGRFSASLGMDPIFHREFVKAQGTRVQGSATP